MEPIRRTIAGIDFAFEDLRAREGFTWMVRAENIAFMLSSPDGREWKIRGKVSVWLQELRPEFAQVIKGHYSLLKK